jgi:acyl-CoA dehydrogenase
MQTMNDSNRPEQAADDISAIVREQADRLFQTHVTKEHLAQADRGEWPAAIWDAVEEAGLPLALAAEEAGGLGLSARDALSLVRRAAYYTLPVPLGETMIALALWSAASGEIVEGPVSLAPTGAADPLTLTRTGEGYMLEGTARRVPWGAVAGHVLVHARDGQGRAHLALVPDGAARAERGRNLANEPRDTIHFSGVVLPETALRPAPPVCADGLLPFGAAMRAVQMVGAMERSLDYALDHANERRQFGRPIAKFQAIQHMLADAAGQYAAAAASADSAGEAWGLDQFPLNAALAKSRAGEAAGKVAAICHQVLAAMGFTQEHPLHFATRRIWSWRDEFGAEAHWEEEIGRMVCREGGEALWDLVIRATDPKHSG